MNCPESTYVYRHALRSYRDLPAARTRRSGGCHRNERSGTLTGLFRVRQFTQDDAHIYCRPDQVQDEITGVLELVRECYEHVRARAVVSSSPRARPTSSGTEQQWDQAEDALHEALERQRSRLRAEARATAPSTGPKIDIHIEDALGRHWQIATIQVDLTMLPERFAAASTSTRTARRSGRW